MSHARSSAGDTIPTECRAIEVRVAELRQLFNAIDPSPFRERDLDPRAEEFIVEWARDLPRDARLALLVHLERSAGQADEAPLLGESIHRYFKQRAMDSRRRLRELFRRGRISLVIALVFLGASIAAGDAVASFLRDTHVAEIIREGLLIGGWVAMWRPLEVFLYDWWPIRAEARLFDRLSTMPVRIEYKETALTDAWRADWPAIPAAEPRPSQARRDHHGGFVGDAQCRPTIRNISTPPTKNEGSGKRPSIRRSRDRSPRVIRRLRFRIQTTTRRSNVRIRKEEQTNTARPDHTRAHQ